MTKGRGGGGAMRWAREAAVCGGQGGHGWLTPAAATKTTVSVDFYCSPRQSLHTNRWPCQGRRPEKQVNKGRTAVAAGGKDGRGCAGRASSGREEESSVVGGGGGNFGVERCPPWYQLVATRGWTRRWPGAAVGSAVVAPRRQRPLTPPCRQLSAKGPSSHRGRRHPHCVGSCRCHRLIDGDGDAENKRAGHKQKQQTATKNDLPEPARTPSFTLTPGGGQTPPGASPAWRLSPETPSRAPPPRHTTRSFGWW